MDLRLSEEQQMLKKAAADFIAAECPPATARQLEQSEDGFSRDVWQKMGELGWMGLAIPEKFHGAGMSFQDLMVLVEEMGRCPLPGPFIPTVISSFPFLEAGTEEQKNEFLPKIASGELIVTPAFLEPSASYRATGVATRATSRGEGFALNGTKLFVEMAHAADYLLVPAITKEGAAPEQGISLFIVPANAKGASIKVMPTIAHDKLCEVKLKDVAVSQKDILGGLNKGWGVVEMTNRKGALAKCAEAVGGMQAVVDMTVSYSKERVQYERQIGAFQALQHIMADMQIALLTSQYLTYEAIWMESEGIQNVKEVSMAKTYVNESYKTVSKWGVRLHGGIGTSQDSDVSMYYRKAKAVDTAFGSTDYHAEVVATKIGLA